MDRLELPFELRQKSRQLARLASGERVGLVVARGRILRGGDVVKTVDGRDFEIIAAPEQIAHIEADDLTRIAYHLGNRHVPVQVGMGFLRIAQDRVLEEMVLKIGARVTHIEVAFEPEGGAYHHHE